jgi:hypothetical protein
MDHGSNRSRRDFLKNCLAGGVILGTRGKAALLGAAEHTTLPLKSRVAVARDPMLRGSGTAVDSGRILSLLDRAMQTLFELDHPAEPWKKLVRPGEKVGIKVNALGGRGLSSNVSLVEAICERLQEAGIRPSDIVIWDRDTDELGHVGFNALAPTAWDTKTNWRRMAAWAAGSRRF